MNILTVSIGVGLLISGIFSAFLRKKKPQNLKQQSIEKYFGSNLGNKLHLLIYVYGLIVAGIYFIYGGIFNDFSIFSL